MWQSSTPAPSAGSHKSAPPARQTQRFVARGLTTELGPVVDVSASGVRVTCHECPEIAVGDVVRLVVRSDRGSVTLKSKVARIKRNGASAAEIGFAFLKPNPKHLVALCRLAGLSD